MGFGRVSPDGTLMSYGSTEVGNRAELFIRPFDPKTATMPETGKVQVTKDGVNGGNFWRADGRELFFVHAEPGSDEFDLMVADIVAKPELRAGAPKKLFSLKDAAAGNTRFVSPDGQNFVFTVRQPKAQ